MNCFEAWCFICVESFWSQSVNPVLLHQCFTIHFCSIWCSVFTTISKLSLDWLLSFESEKLETLRRYDSPLATIWYGSYRDKMGVEIYKRHTIWSFLQSVLDFKSSRRNRLQWNCWIFPLFWPALLEQMRKQSTSTKSFEFKWSSWFINTIFKKWTNITDSRTRRSVTPLKKTLWINSVKWPMKRNINLENVHKQWNQAPNDGNEFAKLELNSFTFQSLTHLSPRFLKICLSSCKNIYHCLALIPRNFIFKPKLSFFKENLKNDNQGKFFDFHEFILHMIFALKNQRIHLGYRVYDFPSKMKILAWNWKFWNFS